MGNALRRPTICAIAFATLAVAGSLSAENWSPLWTTANLSQARGLMGATSAGGKVFFAGGNNGSNDSSVVDIYDTTTGIWSTANLSAPRRQLSATAVGSKVFFGGGWRDAVGASTRVDIYDTSTGVWSTSNLSQARSWLSAASDGAKAYFGGGETTGGAKSNVVDIYNPGTGVWSTASISVARNALEAESVGGKVLFAGGDVASAQTTAVDIYNPITNVWSTTNLSQARGYLSSASAGGKAFFAGGYSSINGDSSVVDIYDSATGIWSTASLSQARRRFAATSVGNSVLFAGGTYCSVVDIYNMATNTWSTANLSQAREHPAASSVGNKAFFAGGYIDGGRSNVVDIYTAQNYGTITSSSGFTLVDQTSVSGLMQLNAPGSLNLANFNLVVGSMSGAAPIDLGSGVLTAGGDNTPTKTYSGPIGGGGSIVKTGSGTLALSGPNTYTGNTIVNEGRLLVNNTSGSGTGSGPVTINAGTLGGTGTIAGPVTVNSGGHIAPGSSIGSFDVGALTLNAGSSLDVELDTILGVVHTSDSINVSLPGGLMISGGTLNLTNAGNMTHGPYTLIDYAGTLGGSVSNLTLGSTPAGFAYRLVNNTSNTSLDLWVTPPGIFGDYNFDGIVDNGDYLIWRKHVGDVVSPCSGGDANCNGFVENSEYEPWRANYGRTVGSGTGASVSAAIPEPSTLALFLAAGMVMLMAAERGCGVKQRIISNLSQA
jgi:autotransporter-associated beta strand protein